MLRRTGPSANLTDKVEHMADLLEIDESYSSSTVALALDQLGECVCEHSDRRSLDVDEFLYRFDLLADDIHEKMENPRTLSQVLISILRLIHCSATICGEPFRPIADKVVVRVVVLCSHADKRVSSMARDCLTTLTECVSYDLRLIMRAGERLRTEEESIHFCVAFSSQIPSIVQSWAPNEVLDTELFQIISNVLMDDRRDVRTHGYAPLAALFEFHRDNYDEKDLVQSYLEQLPKQTVDEIFSHVPQSALAKAIRPFVRRQTHHFAAKRKQMQSPVLARKLFQTPMEKNPSSSTSMAYSRQQLRQREVPPSAFKRRPAPRRAPSSAYRQRSLLDLLLSWLWFWVVVLLAVFGFLSLIWFLWIH
ncbi:unnamed protein product [Aphanomyces euteiches]